MVHPDLTSVWDFGGVVMFVSGETRDTVLEGFTLTGGMGTSWFTHDEAATLKDDIARLEQQYERFNRHANLTFQAESALRKQIAASFAEKNCPPDSSATQRSTFWSTSA